MANEAVKIVHGTQYARRYQVADGTSISAGTLLVLTDANTASASSGTTLSGAFAGIASADKVANDGTTNLGAWVDGSFDLTCNSAVGITAGNLVAMSGANTIRVANASDVNAGAVIGKALETASASEVIKVAVGVLV